MSNAEFAAHIQRVALVSEFSIKTQHVFPPIPLRNWDWCAYDENTAPDGFVGWGATEQAALNDLAEQLAEEVKE